MYTTSPLNGNGDDGVHEWSTTTDTVCYHDGTLVDSTGGGGDEEWACNEAFMIMTFYTTSSSTEREGTTPVELRGRGAHGTAACYAADGVSVRRGSRWQGWNYELHGVLARTLLLLRRVLHL
ncbi:hypothetical protein NLJ89_g10647 [Agrocybe chaxingu]|uniref:Uncharacterized protein n=1 Tax=Agrocybe chaxingu TaxID=84603 RepID=A0A9W8MNQ7_9AGAR|nr:hypothetical protein NLJ89_g10647 [Agrocybe chaxingu]